jgi:hypothetical protein
MVIEVSSKQDLSTYQSPQHVAGMGFPAIRRCDCCERAVLERASQHEKKGSTYPLPCLIPEIGEVEGSGLVQ